MAGGKTEPKFGSFEDLMELSEPAMRPIATRLRQIVLDIHPGAVEGVRLGDRSATYGVGPRKMREGYCYVLPYTSWVNLGFYQGATLPDPEGLLEGTGLKLRHVKVRSVEDAERAALRTIIRAALAERRRALGGA